VQIRRPGGELCGLSPHSRRKRCRHHP
jgi:hypothetical protein